MALSVKLKVFEGPLDLLLYLIEKNKIDIYDIPIVLVTEQYLDYIKQMETEDMNIMSEFLVMAATLLDIKCKMLLPKEVNEEGEEEDPRAELVQKLLEYKMYKYMAYELRDRQVDAGKSWYKKPMLPKEVAEYKFPIDYNELIGDVSLARLHEIFKSVMKRQEDKIDPIRSQFGKIEKDEINIEDKQNYIQRGLGFLGGLQVLLTDALAQQFGSLHGSFHAQVCQDQAFFQFIVKVIVDLGKAGEDAAQSAGQGFPGLGKTGSNFIKKSHCYFLSHCRQPMGIATSGRCPSSQ